MSPVGLIGGAGMGFVLGGPLGALLGALAGHALDRLLAPAPKPAAFSIALIALSAKMAKADGVVVPLEVKAFREVFDIPPEELAGVARVFDLAKQDTAGFEAYARQVGSLFADEPDTREDCWTPSSMWPRPIMRCMSGNWISCGRWAGCWASRAPPMSGSRRATCAGPRSLCGAGSRPRGERCGGEDPLAPACGRASPRPAGGARAAAGRHQARQ